MTTVAHRTGTLRTADPQQTWDRIAPMLPRFGITRVADITDLDEIGLPTMVVFRPDAKTLVVSIGTGLSYAQAKVSAAMENIEVWHTENPVLEASEPFSAREVGLPYDIRSLNLAHRSPVTDRTPLRWALGTGMLSGAGIGVPVDTVGMDFTGEVDWAQALFHPTTNGVASGNTPGEAALHGLLEIIERECIAGFLATDPSRLRYCDPAGISGDYPLTVAEALRRCGCSIEIVDITNRMQIPCYSARIWSDDVPVRSGGFGCHVDAGIALGRALAEAAQSRLAVVSGARDDIGPEAYQPGPPLDPPAGGTVGYRPSADVDTSDLDEVLAFCARRVQQVTGAEPFTVDLSHPEVGIAVQKVYAPGVVLFEHENLRSRPMHRS